MKINKLIDHTLLKAFSTTSEIDVLIDEAIKYDFKSVCVNPCFVKYAKERLINTDVLVCTVIGFPLGANTSVVKAFEAADAVTNGADEIDMVINVGKAREHDYQYIEEEIKMVVSASAMKTTKVILETCYLTDEEKVECCKAAQRAGANFVKTSTGFGTGGATKEDVKLMKNSVSEDMEVKASGGVRNINDLQAMVAAGATRIGASSGVKIMNDESQDSDY